MSKSEKAKELFTKGYNCSQAVLGAFAEDLGMDFETAMKLSSSFGGGMGRMREVCGTVSGMFMAAGLKYGYFLPDDRIGKTDITKEFRSLQKNSRKKISILYAVSFWDLRVMTAVMFLRKERENTIKSVRALNW